MVKDCSVKRSKQGRRSGNNTTNRSEEVTPSHLRTLTHIRDYCKKQEKGEPSSKHDLNNSDTDMKDIINIVKNQTKVYHKYSNEQKLLFVYYNRIKVFSVAKSGHLAGGINERTAQNGPRNSKRTKIGIFLKSK
ncbi:hypothetical protein BD770DRAFT_409580 [Pilaira anomala]|nr:hypothetical protein BD770DRAFT_409580 [Pilaira anomala]